MTVNYGSNKDPKIEIKHLQNSNHTMSHDEQRGRYAKKKIPKRKKQIRDRFVWGPDDIVVIKRDTPWRSEPKKTTKIKYSDEKKEQLDNHIKNIISTLVEAKHDFEFYRGIDPSFRNEHGDITDIEEFLDYGFISGSLRKDVAENFATYFGERPGGQILKIQVRKGQKMNFMIEMAKLEKDDEFEVVLPPNTTLRRVSKGGKDNFKAPPTFKIVDQ